VGRCTVFEGVRVVDARAAFREHGYIACGEIESKIGFGGSENILN